MLVISGSAVYLPHYILEDLYIEQHTSLHKSRTHEFILPSVFKIWVVHVRIMHTNSNLIDVA
jgi:hypothetical protein